MQIYGTMPSLGSIVETCTGALARVTPQDLSPDTLEAAMSMLKGADVGQAIDQYLASLPAKPENERDLPDWEALMREKAKELNRDAHAFNTELSRIKEMHNRLNLPQLDELIRAAQDIIRPLYNFTACLSV